MRNARIPASFFTTVKISHFKKTTEKKLPEKTAENKPPKTTLLRTTY